MVGLIIVVGNTFLKEDYRQTKSQFFITKEKIILQNRYIFLIVELQSYVLKAWNANGDSHQFLYKTIYRVKLPFVLY